ncbi:MAG: HAD hydrolase family protein [Fibrobacterota bacterium]
MVKKSAKHVGKKSVDLKGLKFIAFDFDGVFTTNQVLVSDNGSEAVLCCRSDGLGLSRLRKLGVPMVILSTEKNPVVSVRAKKLCIDCHRGLDDKLTTLKNILRDLGIALSDTAFVGNDINDLPCLMQVGCPVCVADAYPEVKRVARVHLKRPGGFGAVREFCDMVADAKQKPLKKRGQ